MPPKHQFLQQLPDQFTLDNVGSMLMQELAKGLYEPAEVIREYVQNAIDAHRLWRSENGEDPKGPIQIEIGNDRVSILDRGIGMDEAEIKRVKSIAVSTKKQADVLLTGHKGVGIWAGLSYFEKLRITSTKKGEDKAYELVINFRDIVNSISESTNIGVLNDNYSINVYRAEIEEHYTDVSLETPVEAHRDWFLDTERVRDAVRRICPCMFDPTFALQQEVTEWYSSCGFDSFEIEVDGDPVLRSYPSLVGDCCRGVITVEDQPVAYYWYAIHKKNSALQPKGDQLSGLRVIQNGIVLGGDNLYSEDAPGKYDSLKTQSYLKWYIGEIHVVSDELRPDLPRRKFEESESSRQFVKRLRRFYKDLIDQARTVAEQRNRLEEYGKISKRIQAMQAAGAPLSLAPQDIDYLKNCRSQLQEADKRVEDNKGKGGDEKIKALRSTKSERKNLLTAIAALLQVNVQSNESSSGASGPKSTASGTNVSTTAEATNSSSAETSPKADSDQSQHSSEKETPDASTSDGGNDELPESANGSSQSEEETEGYEIMPDIVVGLLREILGEELSEYPDVSERILTKLKLRLSQVTGHESS